MNDLTHLALSRAYEALSEMRGVQLERYDRSIIESDEAMVNLWKIDDVIREIEYILGVKDD